MNQKIENNTEWKRSGWGIGLDLLGWGLFAFWIIVLLVAGRSLPDGAGSIGIGSIVIFGTGLRLLVHASISIFWVIIGLVFLGAGIRSNRGIDLPLLPLALILCGVLLLIHHKSRRRGR